MHPTRRVTRIALPLALALSALPCLPAPLHAQKAQKDQDPVDTWMRWRGPRGDNLAPDTGLLEEWPDGGPAVAWRTEGLGAGFSSVIFAGDSIFTAGDEEEQASLFALDLTNGKIRWTARIGPTGGTRNPGPRGSPTTDGKLVWVLGHDGSLICAEVGTGEITWRQHMKKDFAGRMMSGWGYSESPLIDGDRLVCMPGGRRGTVIALHKNTGKVLWRSSDLVDPAAYTSLMRVEIGGIRQYLVFTSRHVAGIAAEDGKVLWKHQRRGKTAVCSTPVYENGYLFVSSAYKVGCTAFRITAADGAFECEQLYDGMQMQNHHGGLILKDGLVYGLGRRNLKCIDVRTGDVKWEHRSVGKGSIAYADGHLIVRSERGRGEIALVEATGEEYRESGRFAPPLRTDDPAWTHPVVFRGKLYVRDQQSLVVFDLRAGK